MGCCGGSVVMHYANQRSAVSKKSGKVISMKLPKSLQGKVVSKSFYESMQTKLKTNTNEGTLKRLEARKQKILKAKIK